MSLLEKLKYIRNNKKFINDCKKNDKAWDHYVRVVKILQDSGEFHIPAPKTYITQDYISPSNCRCQIVKEDNQQTILF